jgi:hypothetical protein
MKLAHRRSKREQIREFFAERLHQPLNSMALHIRFGTGLRGRISELNRDPDCPITITNQTRTTPDGELSVYTATPREIPDTLFGDIRVQEHRDDG